jgi:hypothetical protein
MEIYSVELDLGSMKIEVSVQNTSPRITFSNILDGKCCDFKVSVFLTAKNKEGQRLWRTPVTDLYGNPKVYESIDEALVDATMRLQNEVKK